MRILDRYILTELLGPFLFGIAVFTGMFIGSSTLFRIAQYVTKYGASITSCVKLFIYSLPSIIAITFPMSMLLATLISFGKLSNSSEITAMKGAGLGFYRLAMPVFVVAFFVSLFSMFFNEMVVPRANAAYQRIVYYEIMKNTRPKSQDHIVIKDVAGGQLTRLTYARRFEEDISTMFAVTVEEFDKDRLVRVENAERAVWNKGGWTLYNGVISDMSPAGRIERTMRFESQVLPVEKNPDAIAREQKRPDEMTIQELKVHISVLKKEHVNIRTYEVELQQRLSVPVASLIFAMIGAPLGLQAHRSSSSMGLAFSVIIVFIYYVIMSVFSALGQGGVVAPSIAAWAPNFVGILAGAYLVRKASR